MDAPVEVRSSSIHGRGVFATRDIKMFESLCFYDGELKSKAQIAKSIQDKEPIDAEYFIHHPRDSNLIMCGYKNPRQKMGIAQLINDSTKPNIEVISLAHGIQECERYIRESIEGANTTFLHEGEDFRIYAVKDIKQDEELFLHYGHQMWLTKIMDDMESLTWKSFLLRLAFLDVDCIYKPFIRL